MKKNYWILLLGIIIISCSFLSFQNAFAETTITARPSGNASNRRMYEMRQFQHSSLEPTGIYVKKGDKLTVTANNVENAKIFIGHYRDYEVESIGKENYKEYDIVNGKNTIVMEDRIGQVYIENFSEKKEVVVSIEGGRKAPTFFLGKTTDKEFFKELEQYKEAPFFELVGDYVFGTFSMELNKDVIVQRTSVKELVEYWDKVFHLENEAMGLYLGGESLGMNVKSHNRINIVNGGDGMYATERLIAFSGVAKDLLTQIPGEGDWGLWHEIGHTYQNPWMLWSSDKYEGAYPGYKMTEVTVNIGSTYVEKKLGITNGRFLQNTEKRKALAEYLNTQSDKKDFDTSSIDPEKFLTDTDTSVWIKLGMLQQLMLAYGENVFAHVNQEYRLMAYGQETMPSTNEEKRQTFMKIVSKVIQRNLVDYFEKWGLYPNDDVKQFMSQYNKPQVPIEQNLLPGNDEPIVDENIGVLDVPMAIAKQSSIALGMKEQDINKNTLVVENSEKNMPSGISEIFDKELHLTSNTVEDSIAKLKITNSSGISNFINVPLDVTYGNALSFKGYGKKERAVLTLQKETKKIQTVSNPKDETVIDSGNEQYAEVTIYKNKQLEEVKKVTVNTNEAPFEFAQALSDISYENGYYIKISMYRDNRLEGYTEGNKVLSLEESKKQEWFKIDNDQFVRLNASPTIHLKTQLPPVYIGEQLETNDFIEKIDDEFDIEKVETSFDQQPDTTTVGEHKTTLIAKNIVGNETRLSISYSVVYGNALSLRAYLPSDERVVIRLDNEKSEIITFANPNRDTVLSSGEGMLWQIVLKNGENGKEKIKLSANKEEKPFDFAKKLNHTRFKEGDLVELLHTSGGEFVKNYKQNEQTKDVLSKENTFVIKNGQFVLVTNEKPTIESLDKVVYEKGQKVTEDQFIKDIQLKTEEGNKISTNFEPTWLEKVGNYDSTVTVENPINHQKVSKQVTICVQDTTPPIITGNKEIEYPLYADVTEQQLFKDLGIQTNKPATLTSNFSRKMLEKEGLYKIEVIAEDSYGNKSEPFLIDLKVKGIHATHTFKKGYWESYGLILNGQVKMIGVDLSKKESVVKTLELIDKSGKVAASIPTVNTNWYTPGQYDGYQATLSAKTIAAVQSGTYKLQVKVKVKDGEEIIAPITVNNQAMFSIQDYKDAFLDIPTNNIGLKTIKTMSKDGQAMLEVTMPDTPVMGLISEGQAKNGRFVNGYILNTEFNFSQKHQKNVLIEDKSGKVVKELKNIHTWDLTSWNLGIAGLDMKSGFQVIIPNEYQNTSLYQYKLQVVTGEEEALQLEVALDKIL